MDLLQMSVSGALLILAAAVFRALALRRVPKGAFLVLWWVASARLLLPVKVPSRFSVYTMLQALRPASAPERPVLAAPPAAGSPVMALPPVAPVETAPAAAAFPVKTVLWFAGAMLLALWFLWNYIRWLRRFRESLPASSPFLTRWLAERPRLQVRISDRISTPLTYGLLRPVILLPRGFDLSEEDALRCILTHEAIHIRRLDGLLKLAVATALCVHWFNPAVWLLYVLANRDMELCCDEAVLNELGQDSRALYAMTLIRMAGNNHLPLCSFSRENCMEERITAIMNFKKKSVFACALALLLAVCISTAFATSAMTAKKNNPAPVSGPEENDVQPSAQIPVDSSARWDEILAPYVPFGLTYTCDAPDPDGNGLRMYFEGREVRAIFDGRTGDWIPEHAGDGLCGEDAAELYAMYDENELTGLRFATDEEQTQSTESQEDASDKQALDELRESVWFENDVCHFTIPEREGDWSIWISGRTAAADGTGMSVRYLEAESEKGEWVPGKTYSFAETSRQVDELVMKASLNRAAAVFDLLPRTEDPKPEPLTAQPQEAPKPSETKPSQTERPESVLSPTTPEPSAAQPQETPKPSETNPPQTENPESVLPPTIQPQDETNPAQTDKPERVLSPAEKEAMENLRRDIEEARESMRKQLVNGDYPRNSKGQTYGNTFGPDLVGYEPDLMAALGTGDETGYIALADTRLSWNETPELSQAYLNWREENNVRGWKIPLYDQEGNVIGNFETTVGYRPKGRILTYEEVMEAKQNGWPNSMGSTPVEREPMFKSVEEAEKAHEAIINGWPDSVDDPAAPEDVD